MVRGGGVCGLAWKIPLAGPPPCETEFHSQERAQIEFGHEGRMKKRLLTSHSRRALAPACAEPAPQTPRGYPLSTIHYQLSPLSPLAPYNHSRARIET